jgi:hypothetical protein
MNQLPSSQPVREMTTSHIISVVFACLSCAFFLIGSILICSLWFGVSTIGSSGGVLIRTDANDEGNFIATILILLAMLFLSWLLGTIALLVARQWVAAALILPVTIGLFIGIYLFLTFVSYHVPGGPKVAFVLLFAILDILLFGAAWRLILRPRYPRLNMKPSF